MAQAVLKRSRKQAQKAEKVKRAHKKRDASSSMMRYFARLFIPRKGSDKTIIACYLILVLFGLIMILSIQNGVGAQAADLALDESIGRQYSVSQAMVRGSVFETFWHQLIFIIVGYMLICFLSHAFNFVRWKLWTPTILFVFFVLLYSTLIIGVERFGSRAWLSLFGFSIEPSEFAKPATIVVYAAAVEAFIQEGNQKEGFWQIFRWPMIFTLMVTLCVFMQKDMGTLLIILGITLICILIPSLKTLKKAQRLIAIGFTSLALVGSAALIFNDFTVDLLQRIPFLSHISARVENMINPYEDIFGEGYQPANSLYSIGDAGLFGKGLGNSVRKYGYLTQAESDYILAVVIEETGILGLLLITICTLLMIYRLFHYAIMTKNNGYRVVLAGTMGYILLHFIINVGGVGGLIPMTGVPLLLISSGGTSLMALCMALGVCEAVICQILRQKRKEEEKSLAKRAQRA